MIYAYRCNVCGMDRDSGERGNSLGPCVGYHCTGEMRRRYVVRTNAVIHSHFNGTTGTVVSSNRDFDEQMRRQSDRVSEYTGMEHRFERVDPGNKEALGVTEQGMDATNRKRAERGLPTFKT